MANVLGELVLQDLRLTRYVLNIQLKSLLESVKDLPKQYIVKTDQNKDQPYVVVPIPMSLQWTPKSMIELGNLIAQTEGLSDLPSLVLAIVAADSSVVYYKFGLDGISLDIRDSSE
ncbi:hypothetical protein BDV3_004136 [Batrachochytrium dendrobatidis]|nr:hypothetical protein O5D80_008667 [Batrachochytrium dendrobatidis]KAK5673557.1 hypothetical protein QVD99_000999 [Batrachochytrium dendrobatidis]